MGRIRKRGATVNVCTGLSPRCLICMETLKPGAVRGQLPCSHNCFCYACIQDWAQVTNKCPLCNARFGIIVKCNQLEKDVLPTTEYLFVGDKDQHPPQGSLTADEFIREIRCVTCGSDMDEHIMLLCDKCDKGYHTTCIGLEHVPNLELWYCDQCLGDMPVDVQIQQWREMELAGRKRRQEVLPESERQRKRLRRQADFPIVEIPRRKSPRSRFRTVTDYPQDYWDASGPEFEAVAAALSFERR